MALILETASVIYLGLDISILDAVRSELGICSRWDRTTLRIKSFGRSGCKEYCLGAELAVYFHCDQVSSQRLQALPNLPKGQATAQRENKET